MPNQPADPLRDAAAAVLAADPDLYARTSRLIDALLRDAETTIRFGAPAERAALMKSMIPGLIRGMQNASSAAADTSEREAVERLYAEMRGDPGNGGGGNGDGPD